MKTRSQFPRRLIVPLVTPLAPDGTVDEGSVAALVERVVAGGVDGILALGTTGEGPMLPTAQRRRLVEAVCAANARLVTLMVGVGDLSTPRMLENAAACADLPVDAWVAHLPSFVPLNPPEQAAYFEALHAATGGPVYAYNFPALTKYEIDLDVLAQLASAGVVRGIKETVEETGRLRRAIGLRERAPDFEVFGGRLSVADVSLFLGVDGLVLGNANVAPRTAAALVRAAEREDWPAVRAIRARLEAACAPLHDVGPVRRSVVQGMKACLAALGVIASDRMVTPFERGRADDAAIAAAARRIAALEREFTQAADGGSR
ncbi:MAG TPA: dihydrodipicolinate synthase family protein [Limnochordia bacterium]